MAGFASRIAHQIDSLDLVEDLIEADYGMGLLPIGRPTSGGVKVLPERTCLPAVAPTGPLGVLVLRHVVGHGGELVARHLSRVFVFGEDGGHHDGVGSVAEADLG